MVGKDLLFAASSCLQKNSKAFSNASYDQFSVIWENPTKMLLQFPSNKILSGHLTQGQYCIWATRQQLFIGLLCFEQKGGHLQFFPPLQLILFQRNHKTIIKIAGINFSANIVALIKKNKLFLTKEKGWEILSGTFPNIFGY